MRIKSLVLAATAALALAACGGTDAGGAPKGEPIAKVAAPAGKAWVDVISKTEAGGYTALLDGSPYLPAAIKWATRTPNYSLSNMARLPARAAPNSRSSRPKS